MTTHNGEWTTNLFIGNIVDSKRILVVSIADIASVILLMGAPVYNALCIMAITVLWGTTGDMRVGGIIEIDENRAAGTLELFSLILFSL